MGVPGSAFQKIEHFFVLMLENRSFDHLLGAQADLQTVPLSGTELCPIDPRDPSQGMLPIRDDAGDLARPDTPHEFHDVYFQLTGLQLSDTGSALYPPGVLPMHGFAASAREGLQRGESARSKQKLREERGSGAYALGCHSPASVPVLSALARHFTVCDAWHSSMPGPTWPNRFFVHAASSGGLDNSPGSIRSGAAVLIDRLGFDFENGTIYDRLGAGNWRVYHDDPLPQVLAIKGMIKGFFGASAQSFRKLDLFERDLNGASPPPKYVFIEPNHAVLSSGRKGNSQHPEGRVSAGETLINTVYTVLRQSPVWEKSVLIITYDEHGGFYDRVSPPPAIPPGDRPLNRDKAKFPAGFGFDRLGVRVPAVIVSPWVERGAIDNTLYDHTSILRTLAQRFDLQPLTERDRTANSFSHLFTLETPRDDTPLTLADLLAHVPSPIDELETDADELRIDAESFPESAPGELDEDDLSIGNLAGFLHIALLAEDILLRQAAGIGQRMRYSLAGLFPALAATKAPELPSRRHARAYIARVADRLQGVREAQPQAAE